MDLDLLLLGLAGSAAAYVFVESERSANIDEITDGIITDSCYRRIDNRSLRLPEKVSFNITGYHSYKAIKRYEKVCAALQEMGDADAREVEKLYEIE